MFSNKILTIFGGTGSFGNAVVNRFLGTDISEIRIFSRDEKKQEDMRIKYSNDKLKFYIGDVRDISSVNNAMRGSDFVFQAAALKQVPSCEFYPLQATLTNVIGTDNVVESAIINEVKKVVVLSTDKAVYPINAMGMSKALMEKVALAKSRNSNRTAICVTRYGNVMASRGSVIPLFVNQIFQEKPITITNPEMTRFMMTLDDAVDLVLFAFEHGDSGDTFVQKAPAATVGLLSNTLRQLLGRHDHEINIIGTRHGEKLYEVLLSSEEMNSCQDMGNYFRVPLDKRNLNYAKYTDLGDPQLALLDNYNSHNTDRLDVDSMKKLLLKLPFIVEASKGNLISPEV